MACPVGKGYRATPFGVKGFTPLPKSCRVEALRGRCGAGDAAGESKNRTTAYPAGEGFRATPFGVKGFTPLPKSCRVEALRGRCRVGDAAGESVKTGGDGGRKHGLSRREGFQSNAVGAKGFTPLPKSCRAEALRRRCGAGDAAGESENGVTAAAAWLVLPGRVLEQRLSA